MEISREEKTLLFDLVRRNGDCQEDISVGEITFQLTALGFELGDAINLAVSFSRESF